MSYMSNREISGMMTHARRTKTRSDTDRDGRETQREERYRNSRGDRQKIVNTRSKNRDENPNTCTDARAGDLKF